MTARPRRLFLILLSGIAYSSMIPFCASTQSFHPREPNIMVDRYSTIEGLSQMDIECLIQDRAGYLWIGTQDGLNRYDGYTFSIHRSFPGDSTTLSSNSITAICEDTEGYIWVGTTTGLNRLDRRDRRFTRMAMHLPGKKEPVLAVTTLARDSSGSVWAGTPFGLFRKRRGDTAFASYRVPGTTSRTASPFPVTTLSVRADGRLLIGTYTARIIVLDPRGGTTAEYALPMEERSRALPPRVTAIAGDRSGLLWVASSIGLFSIDEQTGHIRSWNRQLEAAAPRSTRQIADMICETDGALLLGFTDGLWILDPGTGAMHSVSASMANLQIVEVLSINRLIRDHTGGLWIGTKGLGLYHSDPAAKKFSVFRMDALQNSKPDINYILTFARDRRGELWVGSRNGILRFSPTGSLHRLYDPANRRDGLVHPNCRTSLVDHRGVLYFGTSGGYLLEYDSTRDRFRSHPTPNPMRWNPRRDIIFTIKEYRDSIICVGTLNGVLLFNPRNGSYSKLQDRRGRVLQGTIWCQHVSRNHVLWVGIAGGGVVAADLRAGTFTRYTTNAPPGKALSNNTIWGLTEDSRGNIWIGTAFGLNRLNPATGRVTIYTTANGMPNNVVYGILEDRGGRIWASTNLGITRLDPATGAFRSFDVEDGLQGNEFNQGAFLRDAEGVLYFGGVSGWNAFDPEQIRDNPHPPSVILTGFKVFENEKILEKPIHEIREITLTHEETVFSIEFSAINFIRARKNRYAYIMEGIDRDWVECGPRRFATYTHLDPGVYTFRVRAANNDGVWNMEGLAVRIRVVPPPWKTWWAYSLYGLVALAAIYGAMQFRVRRALEIERLRLRIAADLHDDIGSGLTRIALLSEIMSRQWFTLTRSNAASGREIGDSATAGSLRESMQRVGAISRELVEGMSDVVWSIDPKNDSMEKLIQRLQTFATELCESRDIALEFRSHDGIERLHPGSDVLRTVLLVGKEALNNVSKHSECGRVSVNLSARSGNIALSIRDDGRGFDIETLSRINGLQNMRTRVEKAGGTIAIASEQQKGTTIEIAVPFH